MLLSSYPSTHCQVWTGVSNLFIAKLSQSFKSIYRRITFHCSFCRPFSMQLLMLVFILMCGLIGLPPDIQIKEEPDSENWQLGSDSTLNTSDLSHLRVRLVDEEDQLDEGGKRLRRVACTCPNCKEAGGRWVSSYCVRCLYRLRLECSTAYSAQKSLDGIFPILMFQLQV